MNILPKKRWHVRTKENIARVRADEAKAAEEEAEKERRRRLADSEARLHVLRQKRLKSSGEEAAVEDPSSALVPSTSALGGAVAAITDERGHINFFLDRESGDRDKEDNPEYLQEQKEEREKYEKSVGYLTYLGQDTDEATGRRQWYEKLDRDKDSQLSTEEISKLPEYQAGVKARDDPLSIFKKFMDTSKTESTKSTSGPLFEPKSSSRDAPKPPQRKESKKDHKEKKKTRKRKKSSKKASREKKRSKKSEKKKKKRKKSRSSSSSSNSSSSNEESADEEHWQDRVDIDALRAQRLQRERVEKARIEELLKKKREEELGPEEKEEVVEEDRSRSKKKQYNTQFRPSASGQSLEAGKKYWLD